MIIIERLLNEAEKDTPKTQRYVKPRSASFRAGYYRGLLTAHCMKALGEFPSSNVDPIKTALEMENGMALARAGAETSNEATDTQDENKH